MNRLTNPMSFDINANADGRDLDRPQRLVPTCACPVERRGFLGGLMALGASTVLPGCAAPDSAAAGAAFTAMRNRIDTHHHLFHPPTWLSWSRSTRHRPSSKTGRSRVRWTT